MSNQLWYIKPEFEYLQSSKPQSAKKPSAGSTTSKSPASAAGAKRERAEGDSELPKKAKSAFNHFVKAKRKETETELEAAGPVEKDVLKDVLLKKWEELEAAGKTGKYIAQADEDRKRYEREMVEYEKQTTGKKK